MLDLKFIRLNPELVKRAARLKRMEADVDAIIEMDRLRRERIREVESLKNARNEMSLEVSRRKRLGQDVSDMIVQTKRLSERIKALDEELREFEGKLHELLSWVPNVPHSSVPEGEDSSGNVEVRRVGDPVVFGFPPKAHWELGAELDILDFERASKISGARFALYKGAGARLERALINFMLDLHVGEHGYTEIFPPFLANRESMFTTGQIPKLEQDMFCVQNGVGYLIPTAEVPLTNIHRDEVIPPGVLPLYYTAYSACFRAEAGAAGRDTRGLIRNHQFNKVELVKFVEPDRSYDELERLVDDAEDVLRRLGLPYRVVVLCTGDMSFASAKTYDIEVWLPSYGEYKEISSCSNFEDFQARRGNIRYRPSAGARPELVHTLNGSGLAVGRTLAAVLENNQREDGDVTIPEILRPYMDGAETLRAAAGGRVGLRSDKVI